MARANASLSAEDVAWVMAYAGDVVRIFGEEFVAAADRFKEGPLLLERFKSAIEWVVNNGWAYFRAVDEAHNEMCIASALLKNIRLKFIRLEYEPPLPGCAKTIDFRVTADSGQIVYVDVKTIKPQSKDRWEQFEKAMVEGWFPGNVRVTLSEEWMGGEIWHAWFAARSRMLEYALELEKKIEQCGIAGGGTLFVLAICGDGFHWHESQLEDFVSFYYTGIHRGDDPFAQVEQKYMVEAKISLARTISRIAYVKRSQGSIHPNRMNWQVRSPRDPFF